MAVCKYVFKINKEIATRLTVPSAVLPLKNNGEKSKPNG